VPSQCSALGGCCAPKVPSGPRSWSYPYGAIHGANAANTRKIAVSARPATSIPRCSPTDWRSWWTTGRRSTRRSLAMSVPHPRIEERSDDVDEEVRDRHDDGDHRHDALHGDEVARGEVLHELESEALPLEGGLGEHRAAEHEGDLQPDDGDDGDEGGLVRMLAHQARLSDAARARGVDVGHVVRADDIGAHEPEEDPCGQQTQ